jgi:hypothetical protein
MILIEGNYSILGSAPDGDSIRFMPHNLESWRKLDQPVHSNKTGSTQLRLEAIDSLETHFQAPHSRDKHSQPAKYADLAADRLLELLGFTPATVERDRSSKVIAAEPAITPGYILTNFADQYGRPLALGFAGKPPHADGSNVTPTIALVQQSVNFQLLREGLVYPIFYVNQLALVRQALTEGAIAARISETGLWQADRTLKGFELQSIATLTQEVVLFPKLFRRLIGYIAQKKDVDLVDLEAYLTTNSDRLQLASSQEMTTLLSLLHVSGQNVQLTHPLEDLLFMEK